MSKVQAIIDTKLNAGEEAFLWLHDSGDCILWASEADSDNDDGHRAIGRWQLTGVERNDLHRSGVVDAVG